MGTFSVFHWLLLLIVLGVPGAIIYAVVVLFRRKPPGDPR
jgi:hypothetical protein